MTMGGDRISDNDVISG